MNQTHEIKLLGHLTQRVILSNLVPKLLQWLYHCFMFTLCNNHRQLMCYVLYSIQQTQLELRLSRYRFVYHLKLFLRFRILALEIIEQPCKRHSKR